MRILILPAALLLVISLAACGSDTGAGGDLDVVLDEFSIVTDLDTLPEGPINFDLANL
ncbi:MAG: hypothetical protein IIB18_08255, partial [Chloroflexi bacterium]|nr:hypothetical protein [Chloroflexota bacterium]